MERGSEEIVLTEHFEMHIIVIPKAVKEYKNNKKDEVLQWIMFLNNPENSEVSEIMKIIKKLSSMGMSVTDIADAVGLTETEITKSLNEK